MRNRGGANLSGLRVLKLIDLLIQGFDGEEADCGGIVVESASMVMDHNVNACSGDPLLLATVDGKSLQFGSLAHSHLNQVLKNICDGLAFEEVDSDELKATSRLQQKDSVGSAEIARRDLRTIRHGRLVI